MLTLRIINKNKVFPLFVYKYFSREMDNFKIENICRVCLEGKDDLFSLLRGDFECGDLCQVIKDVAGVIVSIKVEI
jgi:hypothetical protein